MALTLLYASLAMSQVAATPVTVDVELVATTTVPPAVAIKPYRSALVAQEYTVRKVVKGSNADVKVNGKIRVFRWGILEAKPTSVAKARRGDKLRLVIRPLDGWVAMEREYQIDKLESDLSLTYFVEVGLPK